MNILISGASGLIGNSLRQHLMRQGHTVYVLRRDRASGPFHWQPQLGEIHLSDKVEIEAVINLNGENIGERRWSESRKQAILSSRIDTTRLLAQALAKRWHPPKCLINASAIGYYGDSGQQIVDESSAQGSNFLADIASEWEQATAPCEQAGIRCVLLRSGVVLSAYGGALAKMLLPFKLGLGGKIGDGQQYMSWISLLDEVRAIAFLLSHETLTGAVNLTAPQPVRNEEFSDTLARTLRRPARLPMPAFMVKLLFGEMGEQLLLGSCRVHSEVLQSAGFQFKHPQLSDALHWALREVA